MSESNIRDLAMITDQETQLGYLDLLKKRGGVAALSGLLAVTVWVLLNNYVMGTPLHGNQRYIYVIGYFVFVSYFTWKPKLVALLRRGSA